jgi:hypothetical protein
MRNAEQHKGLESSIIPEYCSPDRSDMTLTNDPYGCRNEHRLLHSSELVSVSRSVAELQAAPIW